MFQHVPTTFIWFSPLNGDSLKVSHYIITPDSYHVTLVPNTLGIHGVSSKRKSPLLLLKATINGVVFSPPFQSMVTTPGQDVIGVAKTGSGKTLGYLLPGPIDVSMDYCFWLHRHMEKVCESSYVTRGVVKIIWWFSGTKRSVPSIWWPWHEDKSPMDGGKMFSDFRAASVDSHLSLAIFSEFSPPGYIKVKRNEGKGLRHLVPSLCPCRAFCWSWLWIGTKISPESHDQIPSHLFRTDSPVVQKNNHYHPVTSTVVVIMTYYYYYHHYYYYYYYYYEYEYVIIP